MSKQNRAYIPPTQEELSALMTDFNLSFDSIAEALGFSKRAVRDNFFAKPMLYPVLYTLVHKSTGVSIKQASWRDQLQEFLDEQQGGI